MADTPVAVVGGSGFWEPGTDPNDITNTNTGNVGIGTADPRTILEVANSLLVARSAQQPTINLRRDETVAFTTGMNIGQIQWQGEVNAGGQNNAAAIRNYVESDWVGGNPAYMAFFTAPATGSYVERMRITSAGNVQIGTTLNPPGDTGGWTFQPEGRCNAAVVPSGTAWVPHFRFYSGTSTRGTIESNNASTRYTTSSDYRLKENAVPLIGALDRVSTLSPYRFNFISAPDNTVDGFFAHEVAEVVPEAVSGDKDGEEMQQMDMTVMVPLLTAAIQELTARIEALE